MRISDWSSDVCSSDLAGRSFVGFALGLGHLKGDPAAVGRCRRRGDAFQRREVDLGHGTGHGGGGRGGGERDRAVEKMVSHESGLAMRRGRSSPMRCQAVTMSLIWGGERTSHRGQLTRTASFVQKNRRSDFLFRTKPQSHKEAGGRPQGRSFIIAALCLKVKGVCRFAASTTSSLTCE